MSINNRILIAFFAFFSICTPAFGQTACPQGVSPGDPRCGPGGGNGLWSPPPPERGPEARWKKTWGAIVHDGDAAILGISTGELSRRAAAQAAVQDCQSKGGKACKVVMRYQNQCAAAAYPVVDLGIMKTFFDAGLSIEEAGANAIRGCSGANEGRECEVIYSDCTKPVIVIE